MPTPPRLRLTSLKDIQSRTRHRTKDSHIEVAQPIRVGQYDPLGDSEVTPLVRQCKQHATLLESVDSLHENRHNGSLWCERGHWVKNGCWAIVANRKGGQS